MHTLQKLISLRMALSILAILSGIAPVVLLAELPQPASNGTQKPIPFPGPPPEVAHSARTGNVFTLENRVLSVSWQAAKGKLRMTQFSNKLNGAKFEQNGELFRLALKPSAEPSKVKGLLVGIRLESDRVVALASKDGGAWLELGSFPRAGFSGEPKLVRIGKMNPKAEAKAFTSEAGEVGEGVISDLLPLPPTTLPSGRFEFKASANGTVTKEFPFPTGSKFISCRIDKGTDKGMSWAPALALVWEEGKRFLLVGVREKKPVFNVSTNSGERIVSSNLASYQDFDLPASSFTLLEEPRVVNLTPNPKGIRLAEKLRGVAIEADLVSDLGIRAHWRAELRDGSNYIRQTLDLTATKNITLAGVELADLNLPGAKTAGTVPGSPVVGNDCFLGVEMPGTQNAIGEVGARIGFSCKLELSPAQQYKFGAVAGVAPKGQLRRGFLCYIERERARPSKPFLHYNCWYDLGFKVSAVGMLDVAKSFHDELVIKRGVPVQSYLVDDGWDEPNKGLWTENLGKFPGGFPALKTQMDKLNAHLSIWISPLGGYGGDKERTADAQKMDLIPADGKLDFAYPAYKAWFQDRCLQLMREGGVNAFKWDKAGDGVSPHFMALLDIANHLRAANPDIFINVTVGTWPSPFWLNHVDSTWRNGSADVGWSGKGDDREKWLTFRDGNCRSYFVVPSPLYPLNSAMHHGIVHGRCFQGEKVGKAGPHLRNEARSYFANGASLQELYLTPSMMTPEAWDDVADAAKWAHANADVLVDAHWVGGDPIKLETYGYAAWSPRKGTLMVRNPSDKPQPIALDAAVAFDLPAGAPTRYSLVSPYKDQRVQSLRLESGMVQTITLEPFEVLVFDAKPVSTP